ncbi:MAG: cytochrome c biogenesis protein CcsA [Candidatus Hydrogenedentes bacterium]|nr:cytochrome c biogenesis protein CcsA [Candidatus Hydrogenedentota bacterium]
MIGMYRRAVAYLALCVMTVLAADSALSETRWPKAVQREFASLGIQDGGRIKPLETYASVELLQFNGRRSIKDTSGASLSPMEWFLDCLFFPEDAKQYKSFLVENPDVMAMLSLNSEKDRDRFSYNDLAPARMTLFQLANQYAAIPDKDRATAQTQILNLAHNVADFEALTGFMHFAQHPVSIPNSDAIKEIFGGKAEVRLSEILAQAPALQQALMQASTTGGTASQDLRGFLSAIDAILSHADVLAIIPPAAGGKGQSWFSPATLAESAFSQDKIDDTQIATVAALETLSVSKPDSPEFAAAAGELHRATVSLATGRGEYRTIPLELIYQKADFFWYSLYFYVFSFVLVAISWMAPKNKTLGLLNVVAVLIPTCLLVCGVVLRCIIRSRPPVTTLYETILFITATAVIVALFMEYADRRRVALSLASILGVLGVFLANKYEVVERGDTMPSMIAVLDTNFWLSTHVTTVTMGYAAGLLASAVAHVYVLSAALGLKRNDPGYYHALTRMTYGVMCFGLLFATVGTVLGGIWANNSWGRFWGWDPKENGALMIVLWLLIVLHARIAGYIRDGGIAIGAICCGMIVAFSWFGVNLLGVGLHSYGFTSGIATALKTFYGIESVVLLLAAAVALWRPVPAGEPETSSGSTNNASTLQASDVQS